MNENYLIDQFENKWQKVYWFARMLINNDKYGGIGKDNKLLMAISGSLRLILNDNINKTEEEILTLQKQSLNNILLNRFKNAKSRYARIKKLIEDINKNINDLDEMKVFILTCENILIPINQAIKNIPNDDKEFTLSIAKTYLDIEGEKGLATVVNLWDDLGIKGSLTAERTEIIRIFSTLRIILENDKDLSNNDKDIILTAFVQEFERRAGQKRKKRAGGSLEDVTGFILNYFDIKSINAPEHFQTDIEADKWIKTKDNWLIGISCKRTIRERWKQVSSASAQVLSRFKIKQIYHIVTYDEDLSDDKITMLGEQRHIFYLPDNSRILANAINHIGLKDYVRPMSNFVKDIKEQL